MSTSSLYQVLIVQPQCPFIDIAKALARLGWRRDPLDMAAPPLIHGEPEIATWSWEGQKPLLIYTFNPVVKMRVLDVATVPPQMREAIGSLLPLLQEDAVATLLESDDNRERLLGLWVAQETERVDLLAKAQGLMSDREPVVAEQAREVSQRLQRINEARTQLLVQMNIMAEAAPALIRRLDDRDYVQTLKPSRADLEQLFDAMLVGPAEQASNALYTNPRMVLASIPPETRIQVVASPAGLLRWPNMLSNKFPGGYRTLAGWMNPKRVWMCWKLLDEGTAVSYDGLVWLDGHWVWLPKIYRFLTPYLMSGAATASMH